MAKTSKNFRFLFSEHNGVGGKAARIEKLEVSWGAEGSERGKTSAKGDAVGSLGPMAGDGL